MNTIGKQSRPRRRRRRSTGWWWKAGVVLLLFGGVLVLIDISVGRHQAQALEERRTAREQLERMAWYSLRADLERIEYTDDGRYRVTLWMENLFPEHDLYFMVPAVRAWVQVGASWVEVPVHEPPDERFAGGQVINLKQRIRLDRIVEIGLDEWFEMLEGYMHVQIGNRMFISPQAEPEDDVVERSDSYYVHLKPHGADDEVIRQRHNFPGNTVPLFIPMPPH